MLRSRRIRARVGSLFFGLSFVYVNGSAQTSPASPTQGPVLKTEVRVVLVDVVVTQKKGEAVAGLRREDFQIFEDGKPQTISFFEEHKASPAMSAAVATATTAKATELPPTAPNVFTNSQSAEPPSSVNVILLDWLNTQPQDRSFAQKQIAEYLHRAPAGTSIAAFALGSHLQMLEGFNTNPAVLLAAFEKQKSGPAPSANLLASNTLKASENQMVEMMQIMQTAQAGIDAVRQEQSENAATKTANRAAITLQALQELAHYLSGLPGRKNVIWFSSAFPINLFPDRDVPRQFGQELKRTADLLAQSRVAIYPVSVAGLTQGSSLDMQPLVTPQNPVVGDMDDVASKLSMDALAKGTGGRAFYNTNAIGDALAKSVEVGSHYYTLTYTPFNAVMDGKFRKIEVKVGRRGYKVATREGYYATDPNAEARPTSSADDSLARLVRFGMPDIAQIPFTVHISATEMAPAEAATRGGEPNDAKSNGNRFTVDFNIPLTGLSMESSPDGAFRDSLTILLAAYDVTGKLLKVTKGRTPVTLQLADYARARQQGVLLRSEIEVPRGELVLRTGISEVNSSRMGTLSIPMSQSAIRAAMTAPVEPPASADGASPQPEQPASPMAAEAGLADLSREPAPKAAGPSAPVALPIIGPPCQIEEVLPKVAMHMKEFMENMNQFTATEDLVRERLDQRGKLEARIRRRSEYIVTIQNLGMGNYSVNEYRNYLHGDRHLETGLAASGAPALALVFHPSHLEEFDMNCGNLVNLHGQSAWEVHFRQRKDRPAEISNFLDGHTEFDVLLTGTAWIDSTNFELVRLEADLLQPIPEAKLAVLHQTVDYTAVAFASRHTTLWLPQSAEVNATFRGQRYLDRHTYSDFKLFAVDTGQKIKDPKQPPPQLHP